MHYFKFFPIIQVNYSKKKLRDKETESFLKSEKENSGKHGDYAAEEENKKTFIPQKHIIL